MNEKPGNINAGPYRKPVRIFENSGTVIPEDSYYVRLENVTNSQEQDKKKESNAIVANDIYKKRYIETFFTDAGIGKGK
ncbi:MAG TPA: hypothetical protein VK186_06900 [Candidatus Deferrimicrobium sp.]|nr:hypothetical protein [Candidatus Kapabacteria bacterium]HLP58536.1 hypothetical protein [Candidatus Deferrimicrobium sp.]